MSRNDAKGQSGSPVRRRPEQNTEQNMRAGYQPAPFRGIAALAATRDPVLIDLAGSVPELDDGVVSLA